MNVLQLKHDDRCTNIRILAQSKPLVESWAKVENYVSRYSSKDMLICCPDIQWCPCEELKALDSLWQCTVVWTPSHELLTVLTQRQSPACSDRIAFPSSSPKDLPHKQLVVCSRWLSCGFFLVHEIFVHKRLVPPVELHGTHEHRLKVILSAYGERRFCGNYFNGTC